MGAINRTKLAQGNRGKWVALKQDRKTLVASGTKAKTVYQSALKKGCKNPVITYVPKSGAVFVGGIL